MKGGIHLKTLNDRELCKVTGGCYILAKTVYNLIRVFISSLRYHY